METLLSSLIQLFGTISALALTFLVLLYEAAKRQRETTRQKVLFEITSALECENVKQNAGLTPEHPLRVRLTEQSKHGQPDEADANELVAHLRAQIHNLRTSGVEILPPAEAGRRSQAAAHLEKNHERDLADALRAYSSATRYFATFPARARRVVGFPLAITAVYIAQLLDCASGAPFLPAWANRPLVLLFSFPCLGYIFVIVTRSLKELHSIEQ